LIAAVVADEKKEEEDVEATGSKRRGADRWAGHPSLASAPSPPRHRPLSSSGTL
jgi:hypothetical protein